MINKIPYDLVAIEANKLIVRMALSSYIDYSNNYKLYLFYIEACGWDDSSFDKELLKRINSNWDNLCLN